MKPRCIEMLLWTSVIITAGGPVFSQQSPYFQKDFEKGAQSCARADLFGARKRAPIAHGANLTPSELATSLNGTWVRRLTMYGVPIETDSYYYFSIQGDTGTAMLIDRCNVGADSEKPPKCGVPIMTFVNSDFQIVDRYIKISSDAPNVQQMSLGTVPLPTAFNKLVANNYFNDVPKVDPAWMDQIKSGAEPNGDELIPTVTGGNWTVRLTPVDGGTFSPHFKGVSMVLTGSVTGSLYSKVYSSREEASFFKEGNYLVTDENGWNVNVGDAVIGNEMFKWDKVVIGTTPPPKYSKADPLPQAPERYAEWKATLKVVDKYKTPGIAPELSGIYPVPGKDGFYFVVANKRPVYTSGQEARLPEDLRGKLLTCDHEGKVVKAVALVDGDYGDLAYADGYLYVAVQDPPEIVKFDPETGNVVSRVPIAGPAGGLEYDTDRSLLYAQLFVEHPQLAVIDAKTGATVGSMWSDEGALGLKKISGDLLCTWGFAMGSYGGGVHMADSKGDLRLLDPDTGKVLARTNLSGGVHSCMAPLDKRVAGVNGFISLVTVNGHSGETEVWKYSYAKPSS